MVILPRILENSCQQSAFSQRFKYTQLLRTWNHLFLSTFGQLRLVHFNREMVFISLVCGSSHPFTVLFHVRI